MKNSLFDTYNLFLDDIRTPRDAFVYTHEAFYIIKDWIVVHNFEEFTNTINEKGIPNIVSFDHDLADFHYKKLNMKIDEYDEMVEKTGYHCAKWLIDYCIDNHLDIPEIILIHSMNYVGSENIKSLFLTYKKTYGNEFNK